MFMMLTFKDGNVVDYEVKWYRYSESGHLYYEVIGDNAVRVANGNDVSRIEFYQSREAALVDCADLRDYPPLK